MAKETAVKLPVSAAGGDSSKFIMGAVVIVVILVAGYFAFFNHPSSALVTVTCNKPYILVGSACCLDANNNGVCDADEPQRQTPQQVNRAGQQSAGLSCTDVQNRLPGQWENSSNGMRLVVIPSGNSYSWTVAGNTYSGEYSLDFGNYLHLKKDGQTIFEFHVCFRGDNLQLLGDGGAEYPTMAKVV